MHKIISIIGCWCLAISGVAQPNITRVEYFFNNDPGFGKGISISIPNTPSTNISDQAFTADLGGLPAGLNNLFIRSQNANGDWSLTSKLLFVKSSPTATAPNITKAEYFIDSDPGFGKGINIPITPGADISDINFAVNLASVTDGIHFLFIRSLDANGSWSVTNRFIFVKSSPSANAPNITRVEYFIDNDPGIGSGKNVPVTAGSDISDQAFQVSLEGISEGLHFLYIRSRDANGKWSITNRFLFVKSQPSVNPPNITKAEYFIDNDPGFGKGTNIPVPAGANIADLAVNVDLTGVPEGHHFLYIRSRDALGNWSVTNRQVFVRAAAILPINIVRMEAYIDTDPGFGNGIPIVNNPATNLPDFAFPLNITGLSAGKHRYYIRTQDVNGKWSVTARDSFNIASPSAAPFINVNSITGKNFCGDKTFSLAFHATGTYNPGNLFNVQLSDGNGSFGNPTTIGSYTGTQSAKVNCLVPLKIPNGTGYRVRVVSTNPVVTGAVSDSILVLNDQPRFNDTTVYIVCQQETFNLNGVYSTNPYLVAWDVANAAAAPSGVHRLITTNSGTLQCKDTAFVTVKQDVATWTGSVSADWHNPANWNTGRLPTAVTHVIIPGGNTPLCNLSAADVTVASIQVKPGGNLNTANNRRVLIAAKCSPLPDGP